VARLPRNAALLDLGSSDGETLRHFSELRPDLKFFAADIAGRPDNYPAGCQFHRGNLEQEKLPWPAASMDAITCMHLVEHLNDLNRLFQEAARLLKPGGRIYLETPHPKTVLYSSSIHYPFTLNFYDDTTHIRPVPLGVLAGHCRQHGLEPLTGGTARNYLFAAAWPLYFFAKPSRKKYTSKVNWQGWSACLIAGRK